MRRILLLQTVYILVGTAVFTIIVVPIVCFFTGMSVFPWSNGYSLFEYNEVIFFLYDNDSLYSVNFDIDMKHENELKMSLETGSDSIRIGDVKYSINIDDIVGNDLITLNSSLKANNEDVKVVTLKPFISLTDYTRKMLIIVLSVFAFGFIVAEALASVYNKQKIISPIENLRQATENIASGNLDFEIKRNGEKEIAELYDSVEEMRIKLCESVKTRIKFEENRKFLISGISHDLRTPVTALRGYVEGILDGVANTESKREAYLKSALDKADTVSVMIEDLLLYSKLDVGQLPFELTEVSALDYFEEVFNALKHDYIRQNREMLFNGGIPDSLKIRIDCKMLARVLQNVFDNATKNTDEGVGKIEISLRSNSSSVIVEIKDNGKGISKDKLPHIFDRFYRGDPSRKNDGGSGLGLTIAKQIVEGMGGVIWAIGEDGKGLSILMSFAFIK